MFGAGCECCELFAIMLWKSGKGIEKRGGWAGGGGTGSQADRVDCADHDFARQAGQANHLLPVSPTRSPFIGLMQMISLAMYHAAVQY